MKILLIFASTGRKLYSLNFGKIIKKIPLTFAQLIAVTPEEHKIVIIDERIGDKVNFNEKYDLVGISSLTYSANHAYEIADNLRSKGITVVLGGYHASVFPEEAKEHADSVVIGEAEVNWPELLKDFENDKIKSFYRNDNLIDPKLIPTPYHGSIGDYYPCGDVQATRGCPFGCEFCSIQCVEGSKYRKRPIENVIGEIKLLKNNLFAFYDPTLTIDVEYTKSLFKEMIGLKKRFLCHGNINVLNQNEDLIKLSKKAGCQAWFIGFESLNQESLNSVRKKNTVKNYEETVKKIRKHGIAVKGLFMFGFDADTLDSFPTTLKFVKKMKLDVAYFSILTPLPGTPIFKRYDKDGRILTKNWSHYDWDKVIFEPKNMTKEELYNNTRAVAKDYFSFSNMFRRSLDNKKLDYSRFKTKLGLNWTDRQSIKKEYNF